MASDNIFRSDNIPPACENFSRKLDIISTVALSQCLSSEQLLSIKQNIHSEITELRQKIMLEKEYLQLVKDDLAICKEKVSLIEKWEEGITKLDNDLPIIKKPPNSVLSNGTGNHTSAAHPGTSSSHVAVNDKGSSKNGIPNFRYIDEDEWISVPSYLKSRLKLEQVNDFVQALNKALNEKYTLLKKKKSTLSRSEYTVRASYMALETAETKGTYFVVVADLKKIGVSEKTVSTMGAILRHCRRMREVRTGKTIRLTVMS